MRFIYYQCKTLKNIALVRMRTRVNIALVYGAKNPLYNRGFAPTMCDVVQKQKKHIIFCTT